MSSKDWQSLAGVISSLGLVSILVFIIGRLWTTTYFDHLGLPSSGIEFSIYDFAFRSLEALISLVLGAVFFSIAWLNREQLKQWGFISALIEAVLVIGLILYLVFVLPRLPDSLLAYTGFLGLSSGLALGAMLWFSVDVWAGPGGGVDNWPKWLRDLLGLQGRAQWKKAVALVWRIVAVGMLLAIAFVYLPLVSERLSAIEAAADVATRRFAAAILESEHPLPDAIASSADPTKSKPVRVILSQSQNTYLLHSTGCETIGELEDLAITTDLFVPASAPDVCRVLTIPTNRLTSIEYFQVGRAPANESLLHPVEVALGEEVFKEPFSSRFASDEEDLRCNAKLDDDRETDFFNSIWFEFTPATDGAVLARVETADYRPVIGIWEAPEESTTLQSVAGSGSDMGFACETEWKTFRAQDETGSYRTKMVVGVVANVQAGTRYVASVGALDDRGGDASVSFEFTPGGYFFNPAIAEAQAQVPEVETTPEPGAAPLGATEAPPTEDLVSQAQALAPQVEIVSDAGTTTLEVWGLNPKTYELQPLADIPKEDRKQVLGGKFTGTEFSMKSGEEQRDFVEEKGEDEEQPPTLSARGLTQGIWKLVVPEDFVGLTRVSATVHPDLILAFADTSDPPLRDPCVQRAVLLVLNESEIRDELGYEGNVIFDPASLDEDCQISEPVEDATTSARQLLEEAGVAEEEAFPIQIQVEEERETLLAAADIVQQRLLEIGLDAAIEPCVDACIRVFFRTDEQA